jgi:hypothetical protein
MNIETEIKFPVQLCKKNGDLNIDSIGWSRQPLHRCNLSRKWLRKKRWNYWAVYDDEFLVSFTISNLDYAGVIFCYYWDRKSGTFDEATVITPFGMGCRLGQMVDSDAIYESKGGRGGHLQFTRTEEGYHLEVFFPRKNSAPIEASIDIIVPVYWESLNVVIPFSRSRFQFTEKLFGVTARGTIQAGNIRHAFRENQSFAVLDFGRGVWPYRSKWNWASMSTRTGKKKEVVGVNLGAGWTDGTGYTENGILVGGRLYKIPTDMIFEFDIRNPVKPWKIFSKDSRAIELTLTPEYHRHAVSNLGIIASGVHQMLGRFDGIIRVGRNEYAIEGASGWAEDHVARW